jgi:hypothetical protein
MRHAYRIAFLACLLLFASCATTPTQPDVYDVVVYGGTSAGVVAAVHAARLDKTVVLVAPEKHLGGLTSGGLGWTDTGRKEVIGGVSREFYQRLKKHYDDGESWIYEKPEANRHYQRDSDAIWVFEPRIAEQTFEDMLAEEGVRVVREALLDRDNGVVRNANRQIVSIYTLNKGGYHGRVFIDATYEGDLMAAARVEHTVGRESNALYGESLNGVQFSDEARNHKFTEKVSPFVVPGDPDSGLVARVHGEDPGEPGEGDHRVQAYCYRMCMTNVPENRVPFPKPASYDESQYELLFRHFEAGNTALPLKIDMLLNGKSDTNNKGAFSTDNIGMNYDYPYASYERRAEILKEHEIYQKGLMWTLANHPRVPQSIRDEMAQWGLAADEFTDNGNWPHQIYVREARRMIGETVMTELHLTGQLPVEDSIGMGSYNMDSHNVQRFIARDEDGGLYVQNEGDVQVSPRRAYEISYGSIVPKQGRCKNLLVPVALSSSHIAYGSIRMEPVFMILGHSAATAASIAIDKGIDVQHVPYDELREQLLDEGQVLAMDQTIKLAGIFMDDSQAQLIGDWRFSSSVDGYYGAGYAHDQEIGKGTNRIRYALRVAEPGRYVVRMSFTANPNRATNVPVTIEHADGVETLTVNERTPEGQDKGFVELGTFRFGDRAVVEIGTQGTDGFVVADVVQLLPTD